MGGRRMWHGGLALVLMTCTCAGLDLSRPRTGLASFSRSEARSAAEGSEPRAARRRWALAKMDEMAYERQRCRERFKAPRQIADCETQYGRRYREYNEIYLEASRE